MSEIIADHGKVGRTPAKSSVARIVLASLSGLLRRTADGVARWWRNRQAIHTLSEADPSILRDLGITHSDVERIVRYGRR
jgi:uncharacterized protein YjiS (DUF1127 family)